jgi:hypothetical protein
MAATIAHDFDLPMDQVAAGAKFAIRQLGYRCSEMRAGTSSHTIDFDIPGAVPSRYVLEIRQIVPSASRVFVTGNIPQLCQETLDCIQTTLNE